MKTEENNVSHLIKSTFATPYQFVVQVTDIHYKPQKNLETLTTKMTTKPPLFILQGKPTNIKALLDAHKIKFGVDQFTFEE